VTDGIIVMNLSAVQPLNSAAERTDHGGKREVTWRCSSLSARGVLVRLHARSFDTASLLYRGNDWVMVYLESFQVDNTGS
jgi:hypothetical protein